MSVKVTKFSIGFVSDGPRQDCLALISAFSFLKKSNVQVNNIYLGISNTSSLAQKFTDNFSSMILGDVKPVKIQHEYEKFAPPLKGSMAAYWVFDLLNAIEEKEILLYLDTDTLVVSELKLDNWINKFVESDYKLAAVPQVRPVVERSHFLELMSPYDYFNSGVILAKKIEVNKFDDLPLICEDLRKRDTLDLIWHDQDLLNYIYRNNYLKLPFEYNLSMGLIDQLQDKSYLVSPFFSSSVLKAKKILHFSGNALLVPKAHKFKYYFSRALSETRSLVIANSKLDRSLMSDFVFFNRNCSFFNIIFYTLFMMVKRMVLNFAKLSKLRWS